MPLPLNPVSRRPICPVGALLLGAAVTLSCSTSPPIPTQDAGGGANGTDAPIDRPAPGGAGGGLIDGASVDGARESLGALGATCAVSGDCGSGHCFDGVCCAQDCSEACHSCALPGNIGTCLLAEVGTDPHADCEDQGSDTCGTDGTCDGSGACRRYPTGIVCKPPSCSGATLTLAFRCAAGACSPTSGQPCDPYLCGSATRCATTCTKDQDCTPPTLCTNGSCGKRPLGGPCSLPEDCNSLICQQGVCCGSTCTGACRSCALPGSEGTCTNVPERQDPLDQCVDTGPTSCGTEGSCDGAGACRFYARGTTCRAAAGICDVAETCAGTGAPCPADSFAVGTTCHASAGLCDVAETCSGTSAGCPPDALAPALTVCRQPAGICDLAETCSGTSVTCPPDGFAAATTICRAMVGNCDVAETCTGTGATCPTDRFVSANSVCRAPVGLCDAPEACTGTSGVCPPDVPMPAQSVCRAAADLCDAAERCNGNTADCPADGFLPSSATCRPMAGPCDIAESCTGTGPACPADRLVAALTMCRQAAGMCDVAEVCSGTGPACPPDAFVAALTTCRIATDLCDATEVCPGNGPACPPDGLLTEGTPCRGAVDLCDAVETCSGTGPSCPPDGVLALGTVCRAAAGACDVAEVCPGGSVVCPPDGLVPMGTTCRAAMGSCDLAEICDGALASCPIDVSAPIPVAPAVAATRGNQLVTLTWPAVPGATSYNVKRSSTSGGPYTTIGTTAATTFTNTGLTNGATFFFVVSATSLAGGCESPNSAQAAAIPNACAGVYCDDFEADTPITMANGWMRVGGSDGDWAVVADGSKFFAQRGAVSSTTRASFSSGAPNAPWSGAISISADVKLTALGLNAQAALVCARFVDISNYYCLALLPTGVQIQTRVNGAAVNSAIFPQTITTGSIRQVKLSLSAGGVLTAILDSSLAATLTPTPLASGFVAVMTMSVEAEFDTIVVSQP